MSIKKQKTFFLIFYALYILVMIILTRTLRIPQYAYMTLLLAIPMILNFWYAYKKDIPIISKNLSIIFAPIGFFYLMGYDKNMTSAGELMEDTLELYEHNFSSFFRYVFLFAISSTVIVLSSTAIEIVRERSAGEVTVLLGSLLAVFILLYFIAIFATFLFSFTLIRVIAQKITQGQQKHMAEELHDGLQLFWPAFWIYIILQIYFFIFVLIQGMVYRTIFALPIIILFAVFIIWIIFSIHAIVIDNIRGFASIRVSMALVRRHAWNVFWKISVASGIFAIAYMVIPTVLGLPFELLLLQFSDLNSNSSIILNNILALFQSFIGYLLAPLVVFIPPTFVYFELKQKLLEESESTE